MTSPGIYDYEVEGGDCLTLAVTLKDANDALIDITGASSAFSVSWSGGSISLTTANDRLDSAAFDSPMTGEISGELTGAETDSLPYGRIATYEWSITAASGCKTTFLKGYIVRT